MSRERFQAAAPVGQSEPVRVPAQKVAAMPISSVAGMTQHQMLKSKVPGSDVIVSNHPPPPRTATLLCCSVAECRWLGWVQYVQTQLDGGVSIPPRDQARTKKWKNKAKKRDARKEQADEIKEVAELADQPTSYTLATLPSGSQMWVPIGQDPEQYATQISAAMGISSPSPPPTADAKAK